MFGNTWDDYRAVMFHESCQKGSKCTGPGCRVYTGKTAAKRRKRGRLTSRQKGKKA